MAVPEFDLDQKPVFDWKHVPIGTVTGTQRNPRTQTMRRLRLTLSPEAQIELGLSESVIELPASRIFGIRRDAVTLDRTLPELKRFDLVTAVLKR